MAKETKVTDRNGDERIIKRSKLRIGIITLVVLILLTLIGVGIYFIVQMASTNEIDEDNWEVASIKEVREDILDDTDDSHEIGVFFYKDDSAVTNFMLRDNTIFENGEKGAGALSEVMAANDDMTWYGVKIPDTNELIEELLTQKVDGIAGEDEYIFYDEFEYLGAGTSLRHDMWVINQLSGTDNDTDESFSVDDKAYGSFSLSVVTNDGEDEDDLRDVYFTDSTTDNGGDGTGETGSAPMTRSGSKYTISEGTTMFFKDENLTGVVNSWGTVEVTEDADETDDSADTRDEYHEDYVTFLGEMIEHNKDY